MRMACGRCDTRLEPVSLAAHRNLHVHPRERVDLELNCRTCRRLFHPRELDAHERVCEEVAPPIPENAEELKDEAYARYERLLSETGIPWPQRLRRFRLGECSRVTDDALFCGVCNSFHWGRPPRVPQGLGARRLCPVCDKRFRDRSSLSRHLKRHRDSAAPIAEHSPPPLLRQDPIETLWRVLRCLDPVQ